MARNSGTPAARRAARGALDQRFGVLRELLRAAATPRGGWVLAIREALGMSAADLGARMGVSETSVLSLEANERDDRAQLGTLRRAAAALDCELVYVLVPRAPLGTLATERAVKLARTALAGVEHHMALEGQEVDAAATRRQLAEYAEQLLDSPGLWRDGRA